MPAFTASSVLFYVGYVLGWTVAISAGGAVVGAILFPLVGLLIGKDMTVSAMILSGARQIGFLTFIWAFGIAVVMAFQRAYKRRHSHPVRPPSPSSSANEG
jgi:hypothetical protein